MVKRFNEFSDVPAESEYPVLYVVKRFYRKGSAGEWREEYSSESLREAEDYVERERKQYTSYNPGGGATGRFGIYTQQLLKFVGEE